MYKLFTISSIFILVLSSCAQFVPPTGGEKDNIPPKLLKSIPENKALNSKTNLIELQFDEAIDVSNLKQELSVSPELSGGFEVKNKLTSVQIKFAEDLRDSTTYTFNFKNGIKDLNEKNPAKNLRLVFSTGNKIDSLGLKGKVTDLFTKKNAVETTIGLYDISKKDTLSFFKRKPDYFVKTDSSGTFIFENIRDGLFRVFAFQDKNNNLLIDLETEKAGFVQDTLKLKTQYDEKKIEIYAADTDSVQVKRRTPRATTFSITFSKPILDIKVQPKGNVKNLPFSYTSNEVVFYKDVKSPLDSTEVYLTLTDSTLRTSRIQEKVKFLSNSSQKKTNTEVSWITQPEARKQTIELSEIQVKTLVPLDTLIKEKIILRKDTVGVLPFLLEKITATEFVLKLEQKIEKKETIELQIEAGALRSVLGDTNTTKKIEIISLPKSETGQLTLTLAQECTSCFVELLDNTNLKLIRKESISKQFIFQELLSGDYRFRIVQDNNKNGYWDNGNLKNNILPENVYFHPDVIKIKTNFEIEQQVNPFP